MKIPDAKAAVDKEWKKLETIPARDVIKVKSKKEVIKEIQKNNTKVHFASLMDLCHLKNSELEPQFQKYKGGVVLRGDMVKDDSGAYAVFTEQGSSASQMTAAKVMNVIARLPDCDGQAADAISAYTQVKMEDAQQLFLWKKNKTETNQNVLMCGYVFQNMYGRSHWEHIEDPVCSLNETYTDTHSQDSCGKDSLRILWRNLVGKKYQIGNAYSFIENKNYSYRSMWMTSNMAGKKQNMAPMWKKLMKDVDIEEPTSLLDHVCLGCTRRKCKPSEIIIRNIQRSLNHVFLLEQLRNHQDGTNLARKLQRGPTTWKDMIENAWNGIATWRTKRRSNFNKFLILFWTITKGKKNRKKR